MNARLRYSDEMARRIRCLRTGSFECLVQGGVYDEAEAEAVLPYLDVSYHGGHFLVAVVHAALDIDTVAALSQDNRCPALTCSRVLSRRIGRRGYVQFKHDDVLTLLWCPPKGDPQDELRRLFIDASKELFARHKIRITCGIGGWRRHLTDAPLSYQEARCALEQASRTEEHVAAAACEPETCAVTADASLVRCAGGAAPGKLSEHEPARTIQRYILTNYQNPNLTLSMVAARFGLTETYLSQLFKEQAGVNYSVYLEDIRIREARRLLEETGLAVSEAASRVGYQINSTFYRAFKRTFGVSPSTYRNGIRSSAVRPDSETYAPDGARPRNHARAM